MALFLAFIVASVNVACADDRIQIHSPATDELVPSHKIIFKYDSQGAAATAAGMYLSTGDREMRLEHPAAALVFVDIAAG